MLYQYFFYKIVKNGIENARKFIFYDLETSYERIKPLVG